MSFTKNNVSLHEYKMHKHIYDLNIVNIPKIISYKDNVMIMENIPEDNISNNYGADSNDVPNYIFDEIRKIIKKLYDNNIIYPDITGYNFIEYKNKIWIIDFEHAYFKDDFVNKFMDGLNSWNPKFE
tara:strand:- start:309 stop:689 length:381 start_codon:yes stop_codon:yes gene_type:complete